MQAFTKNNCRLRVLAAAALLAACAAAPEQRSEAPIAAPAMAVEQLAAEAESALKAGRFREAAEFYDRAARVSDDEALAEKAARVAYEHDQLNHALVAASRWLTINSTNQDARRMAGLTALKLYRIEEARAHFAALLGSAYITPAIGFVELLPELDGAGSAAAATALLQRLIADYPEVAEAHYALAHFALQTGNFGLAVQEAARAQQLSPYWTPASFLLAQAQLNAGDVEGSLATVRSAVAQNSDADARTNYALLLLATKREEEGSKLLQELEEKEPDAGATRALAMADFQRGNYEAAFKRFNQLLMQGRNVYESMFYIGAIAERSGAADQALQLYSKVVEGPFALPAQVRSAELVLQKGDLDGALNSLQEFGNANPGYAIEIINARVDLLNQAGDESGALALLEDALNQYQDSPALRMNHAFQLVRVKKTKEAIAQMRALVADRPDDPLVLNALGYTLVDNTRLYSEGHEFIARALEYMPDSGAVMDSMGWALFKLGRKDEALQYLQRAAERIVDSDLDLHLGEVLWALKRRDEARETWQAGLRRDPYNEQLRKRVERFNK